MNKWSQSTRLAAILIPVVFILFAAIAIPVLIDNSEYEKEHKYAIETAEARASQMGLTLEAFKRLTLTPPATATLTPSPTATNAPIPTPARKHKDSDTGPQPSGPCGPNDPSCQP